MISTNTDDSSYWILGFTVAFILLLMFIRAVCFFYDFSKELKYLNSEIDRADDDEIDYYLYKRRRLWLSLIPFVKYRWD